MASASLLDPQHGLQPGGKKAKLFENTFLLQEMTHCLGMRLKVSDEAKPEEFSVGSLSSSSAGA